MTFLFLSLSPDSSLDVETHRAHSLLQESEVTRVKAHCAFTPSRGRLVLLRATQALCQGFYWFSA